jgi:two-component system response regulator HydG
MTEKIHCGINRQSEETMSEKKMTGPGVLMVDDEENFLLPASIALKASGIDPVWTISDSRRVMSFLEENSPGAVILDLTMPHLTGRELLSMITESHPGIPVIILTAHDDITMAIQCMKEGARDYLVKPVEECRLISSIKSCIEVVQLQQEMQSLKTHFLDKKPVDDQAFAPIITSSDHIRTLFTYIKAVAPSNHPVLITGETGTGKELFARAVHEMSGREGEYVAVNVAGLDDNHFTDTLFGHQRGAFTGAERKRDGLVSKTGDGTLFLDEIGDLAESSQVKLLRLLQEKQYYPLGSDIVKPSRARVIVATNRDIHNLVRKGAFRKDLYYRLKTHEICVPPLRDRLADLPVLVGHFLEMAAHSLGKKTPNYPGELLTLLKNYQFPGNIRELESMVNDAVARYESGVLSMDSFKQAIQFERGMTENEAPLKPEHHGTLLKERFSYTGSFPTIREVEEYLIKEAMTRSEGNQTIAADLLGITRQTLNKRLTRVRREN